MIHLDDKREQIHQLIKLMHKFNKLRFKMSFSRNQ
jgi:hypothetical protein